MEFIFPTSYQGTHTQAARRPLGVLLVSLVFTLVIGTLRANQPVLPPNWTVDPGAYQFNMSIIARVNYLGLPTNAAGNIVGVFVGSELRGVATPLDISGEMYYFITVYSNIASGENLSFKVYYQPNDAVYSSQQSLPFITNALEGTVPAPYWIFVDNVTDLPPHFNTIPNDTTLVGIPFETVNLANYLISDDGDPVTYSVVSGANLSATVNGAILTVSPISGSWTGTDTVRVVATEQTANMKSGSTTPKFTVNPFYAAPVLNAIPSQSINVGQTFSNYDLDNALIFTGSCRAFDYYVTPFNGSTANPGWATVAPGANPMTVTARPLFDKIQLAGAGTELAAFRGNTLVGKAGPTGTAPNITYNFTLANLGTGNLTFKLYDASKQYLYTLATNLAFVPGGAAGSAGAPYLIQYCPLSPSIATSGVVSMGINDTNWFGTLPVNYMVWDCPFPNLAARRDTATGSYTRFNNPNPTIISSAGVNFQEQTCLELYDAQTYDPNFSEGSGLTYALVGGADQAKFSINATTGKLSWNNFVPNFETPADANADNKYLVTIRVTNTNNLTDEITLEVTVTDNPVESFTPAINGGSTVCLSASVLLTTSGGGTYSWSTGQTTASIGVAQAGLYTVTVTNAVLCTGVASVTVYPAPTISLTGSSSTVCIGDQITLLSTPGSGTAPYTFGWGGPNSYTSTQEDPAPFAAAAGTGGNYQLTVTDSKGCTVTSTQAVVFKSEAKPTLVATASTPICTGAPIALTVTATGGTTPYSYAWSGPNNFNAGVQNPASFNATVAAAGNYLISVTSNGGCISTASETVVVNASPTITASGATPVCQGSDVTLTSSTTGGTAPYSYLWNGPNNFTATVANPIPFPGSAAASGTYTVTVTDGNGCTATSGKAIVVSTTNVAPTVGTTANSPVCVGANVILTSSATGGTAPYTYSWTGPLNFTSGGQNPAPFAATVGAAGTYTLTVTSANGCSSMATRILQVNAKPTMVAASNSPVCIGTPVLLTSAPQGGNGNFTFSWQGPASFSATLEDPTGFNAVSASAGTYTVTVTDGNSCSSTATTSVTIRPAPSVTITTGPTCLNNNLAFNATPSGGNPPYTTFAWSGPNGFTSALEDPTPFMLTTAAEGIYTLTVTDNSGCTATASKTVAGFSNPTITASNSGPTCQGSLLTLTALPQGGTGTYAFLWTGPAGSGYSATFQNPFPFTTSMFSNGVYTIKVTDANGCTGTAVTTAVIKPLPTVTVANNGPLCFGATALLTSNTTGGSGSYTGYTWSGPLGYASTEANPTGFVANSASQGGIYNLVVTDANGCTSTASTSMSVSNNSAPSVAISSNAPVCASGTLNLFANASGGSGAYAGYSWTGPGNYTANTQNPSIAGIITAQAGNYTVTVTDVGGCSASATANVSVVGATVTMSKTDVVCAGGNTGTATVSHTGGVPPYSYLWSNGGTSPTITGLAAGVYTVTLTPQGASTCEQTASVQVNQASNLQVSITSFTAACSGSSGTATVSATGGTPPYAYQWPATAGNQTTTTATNLGTGTYVVTVTDNANCTGTTSVTIVTGIGTTINAIANKGPICPGKPVSATPLASTPANAATVFSWTGGALAGLANGTSTGSGAVIPAFTAGLTEGTYTVTVSATLNGCVSTTTFTSTTQDDTAPVISNCPSNQTFNNTPGLCTGVVSWSIPTASDNCGAVTVTQNGGPAPGSALAVGNTQTISYTANDFGGNNATCSFTVTVVDNELPAINCPTIPVTIGTNLGNCSYTIAGTGFNAFASDNCGLKAGAAGLSFTATGAYTGTGTQLNTVVLPKGSTAITWSATDVNNNNRTCVMNVNVVDDDAPIITVCPPNQIMLTSSNGLGDCAGAVPNFIGALAATDNCTSFANLTKTQLPAVGATFSGNHGDSEVVVMTVVDEAGNSTFCTAVVTIVDDEVPIYVNCPDTIVLNNDVDNCGANVFFTPPGATDNCSGQVVITQISGPVPGTYVPVNVVQSVTFKAQDGAGNVSLCQASLIVRDAQSPKLVCPAGVQDFDASANCNYIGTLPLNASATDNCALATLQNSVNNTNSVIGQVFPLGNTIVAWTATDIYGNTATCSYTIQITDQTAPIISVCPPSRVINTNSNGAGDCTGLVPNLLAELVVADNCSSGANLVKVQTPAANSSFGTAHNSVQVVQYTVTDEAGNISSCTTSLTLNDNENPVVTNCPPNLTASTTDQYPCYATRTWIHPGATDNCQIGQYDFRILNPNNAVYGPVNIDPLNASYSFEVGTSVVSYQVSDLKGNTATCSFSVVVTTVKSLVGDKIWHDQNGNGVQDPGEPGISGVSVTLQGTKLCDAAPVTQTVTSGVNGDFAFTAVEPGTYKVLFGIPANYIPTAPSKGNDEAMDSDYGDLGLSDPFEILVADTLRTLDAGYYIPTRIGNLVWDDLNGNGLIDIGEPGISGALVLLTGTSGDGSQVSMSTTTDANGQFVFGATSSGSTTLVPGTYQLSFVTPTGGYVRTNPNDPDGTDENDSDADLNTGATVFEVLVSEENNISYDAGFYRPPSIGNYVWEDINANGIQENNEPAIGNASVTLTGTDGQGNAVNQTILTDIYGHYLFENLIPGTYKLTFPIPSGFNAVTYVNQNADDTKDSDAFTGTNMTSNEVLVSGENNETYDAGFYRYARIGDKVWDDYNANGEQNPGEPGKSGVQLTLNGQTGNGTPLSGSATTGSDGSYIFGNLIPGTYTLTFTTPNGFLITQANTAGGNDDADSDIDPSGAAPINQLLSGEFDTSVDAGYYATDYGDLPNTYATQNGTSNGAYHILNPNLYLGTCVDGELNGGDDAQQGTPKYGTCPTGDDENGITFVTPLVQGIDACIQVTAFNTTGTTAVLQGWVDFNGDGDFLDAGELITLSNGGIIPAGGVSNALYCFPVPADATFQGGSANARFRLTHTGGYPSYGMAIGGEMEDYPVKVSRLGNLVWNDVNFNGTQDAGEDGIANVPVELTWAGPDNDLNTSGDNRVYETETNLGGLYYFAGILQGTYRLKVIAPAMATPGNDGLSNEDTDSDGEISGGDLSVVTQVFTIADPLNLPTGETGIGDVGVGAGFADAQSDETHDFAFGFLDYGDLPENGSAFHTTLAADAAAHATYPKLTLGSCVDAERDGMPDDDAGIYDQLTTDTGDGDDGINTLSIDQQNCVGDPLGVVSAASFLCENKLILKRINTAGQVEFLIVNGDFSPQINAAGGFAAVLGSQVIISGTPVIGAYAGNANSLISCLAQQEGLAIELVKIAGTVSINFQCFDKNTTCNDDENGIVFETPLVPSFEACIRVTAQNAASTAAVLQGWIDWDGNGALDASEALQWSNSGAIPVGGVANAQFCFPVPATAKFNAGKVYARFRLSPNGGLQADGPATFSGAELPLGEVEDYILEVGMVGNRIWEDRNYDGIQDDPANEPGLNGVAVELTWAGPDGDLATAADNRLYTQTTGVKNGNPGMYYFFGLINGKYMLKADGPADFIPTLINQGNNDQLDADDFVNGDVFTWPDVTNLITGEAGVHDLPGQIPNFPDKHDDQTHDMGFVAVDLGDNPNTYATLTADNGARATIVPGLYLGSGVDSESDGQPDQQSGNDPTGGDDNDPSAYNVGTVPANGDDEDGFNLLTPIIPGFEACASIQTTVPGAPYTPAYVSVWLDLNGNAAFDLNEKLTFTSIDGATVNTAAPQLPQGLATRRYCFQVPTDAVYNNGNAYFRIRLNTTANIPPTGTVPYGEVEDYWKPVARSGNFVWMDSDIEGDQDVSEMPLAGVTMVLRWAGEDQNFNTADDRTYGNLTDANGRYGWLGLISGPYRITPLKYLGGSNPVNGIAPLGKILTIPNLAPANDFNDSDAAPFMALAVPDMLTNFLVTGEDGLYDNNGQLSFPDNQEDNSLDAGFIDEPKIASALQISGIEKASSGTCGRFDVILTLCIQNSGKVPVNNLEASLDLGGANAFGSMFLGFVPNGTPAISSSDAQQDPVLAANYDGSTNIALFNGTSGLLWPNQKVCIRMRFELNPTAPGAPNAPDVQALIKGFAVNFQNVPIPDFINGGQFMVNDLSDDGDDPLTTNPLAPGDNGTADDPTPLTDCWKIAAPLVANDVVHVSMDSTCLALIEASMILEGEADDCTDFNYPLGGYYKVTLRDLNTNQIIPNPLTPDKLGQTIVVEIEHKVSCNKTWGKLILEDKLAPKLTCPPNITIACSQPLAPSTTGNVSIQDCSPTTTQIAESVQDNGECGTPRLEMQRTFIVTDSWTNQTTCSHLITVLPFNLPEIVMPADVTVDCETAYLNPNATAPVVTGQPSINGSPVGASLCSATLGYTDVVTYGCAGNYDIFRTWVVSNSCLPTGPGNPIEYLQRIRVKDFGGPVFTCPGNITVSTDPFTCCATAPLPDVVISEGCSQIINLEARVTGVDPSSGNITTFTIPGTYSDFPGNNYWKPDTLAVFAFTQCLPEGNTYTVKYSASDNCANLSSCEFLLTVEDLVPPVSACDAFTQVALGNDGIAIIDAATFNDGSKDYCHAIEFRVRPMVSSACQSNDQFEPTISFCCDDIGDSVLVQFRVYDVDVTEDSVDPDDYEGHFNDCMVTVLVEDKIKPTCNAPANVTVSCENFDPSLTAYGLPEILDNCCLDSTKVFQGQIGLSQTLNLSLFDSLCNKGTITRTFRAFDCGGNSSQCTQRIVVNYEQDYYVKFPNDVIVTSCDGTGDFGKPTFVGKDCEALGITFEDQIFTVVPDACFEIQRTWKIINWCTYNANLPYTIVPNPNPNSNSTSSQNLPGPVVSPAGTPAPWAPTVVKLLPTDPTSTDFSSFWTANVNGYQYVQIIKVQDGQDPAISNCPDSTVVFNDQTVNEKYHWNETYWWDNALGIHDLCEGPTDLSITAIDSCSGADLKISYLLFLDLDNDNVQETVISSDQTGLGGLGWNKVPFGNATNPNYSGGTLRAFDQRPGAPNFKYGFALETLVVGNTRVGRVRWNTQANQNTYVVPELPYGKHRILWVVEDGCGNEKTCEYSFEVKDGKAPTVVCLNGLSTNLSGVGISQTLWASDFLQYTEDNCTPVAQLVTGIRKKGAGTGFPYNPDGTPQTSVSYSCSELGTQLVELWSIDKAGNAAYCETYLIVQDNDGVCPSDSNSAKVAGFLLTEAANGLEEGSVEITGTGNAIPSFTYSSLTGASGKYLFNAVPLSSNSTVTPLKDDNHLNGVSTYDLVLISRHILGIDTLDSPYKMIAADANNSESITNFDIVELRRLILGITIELGSNTSWRFVDKAFVFPDPLQPFLTNFPEFKSILSLSGNQLEEDFVAIKVGDVNTNAIANALMSSDDRSNGTLLFDLEDRQIAAGETFTVALKASEVTTAYQFTLQFPGLEVVDILPGAGMRGENFGVFANAITTSYDGPLAGEFAIRFRASRSGKLSALLSVSSRITKAEAYQNGTLLDVALRFNQGAQQTIAGVGFELYQNQPNPFVHKTMIPFNLPEASNALLSIYDETGRLVYTQKGNFAKGYNTVAVDLSALNTGGLLYYKLETERDAATQKMVQMK